jgi:thymidylate synthase
MTKQTTAHSSGRARSEPPALAGPRVFDTAQEAWLAVLAQTLLHGEVVPGVCDPSSVGSAFGGKIRDTRELSAVTFSIASPRRRLISSGPRAVDLGYAIANVIWTLSASDYLKPISFYNPHGERFSDDGVRLFAAPGARIFASPEGDQFERAIKRLKEDPTTRRAVIQIFSPADLFANTRDCSCLVSLQFLFRGNALSCIACMRSQSALMVMPYDIFLLSMIHEAAALHMGVEPGPYYHFCGSLHYYDDEEGLARAVIEENAPPAGEMPAMLDASAEVRERLATAERDIRGRLAADLHRPIEVRQYGLDSYWTELLNVMVAGFRRRHGLELAEEQLAGISDIYRRLLIGPQTGGTG